MHASPQDTDFKDRFETHRIPPSEFDHRSHLRLAYVYLCDLPVNAAHARMKASLKSYLHANGVPEDKYHETLTLAWIKAVNYFMEKGGPFQSFDAFLEADDCLLDSNIMLSHYSKETLFSNAARAVFVEPDRSQIPSGL